MYTQCPECLTIFKLAAADLGAAHGSVRCGHCNAVFDALRAIAEQLPPEPIGNLDVHAAQSAPPQLGLPVFRPNPSPSQGALFFDPDERPKRNERPASPTFTRSRSRRGTPRQWPWALGSAVLLLTLAGQVAWAERGLWIDSADIRPLADQACAALGCTLPLRRDTAHLALVSRDIRPHPSVAGALIISATVRNDADFAQRFPNVEITLSDLDENRIAMRRFHPREYVSDARTLATGLAPGATAALVFEVEDPGKNAVAFEFKFQ